jgi:membrane protein implicated in regulation of membrane protease activity
VSPRYSAVAEASAAGLFFPVAIVAGYWLGARAGSWLRLGTAPAFLGAALGVVAAFVNLFRFLRRLEAGPRERP